MEKKNNLDPQYNKLLQDILDNGTKKQTRNGEVLSVFGRQIRHNMADGFPLLTGKKMFWKGIVTELLWFLRGDTNIKFLVDNDCHIWDGDAYKAYEKWNENATATSPFGPVPKLSKEDFIKAIKLDDKFAKQFGDLGPVYGMQWRSWGKYLANGNNLYFDQIANLITSLKANPDSRRLMVSAWNVSELNQMTLPPCHYGFQVYTRELSLEERNDLLNKKTNRNHTRENCFSDEEFERETLQDCKAFNIPTRAISLMFNMRSNDVPLGLPFNLASYGLLLQIIAKEVNMVPDELIASLGDAHIYVNQIDAIKEQLTREPYPLPTLVINDEFWNPDASLIEQINYIEITDFEIRDYQSHPTIKIPLSN